MAAAESAHASASHYGNTEFAQVGANVESQTIAHHIAVETVEEGERMGRHAPVRRATEVTG